MGRWGRGYGSRDRYGTAVSGRKSWQNNHNDSKKGDSMKEIKELQKARAALSADHPVRVWLDDHLQDNHRQRLRQLPLSQRLAAAEKAESQLKERVKRNILHVEQIF